MFFVAHSHPLPPGFIFCDTPRGGPRVTLSVDSNPDTRAATQGKEPFRDCWGLVGGKDLEDLCLRWGGGCSVAHPPGPPPTPMCVVLTSCSRTLSQTVSEWCVCVCVCVCVCRFTHL